MTEVYYFYANFGIKQAVIKSCTGITHAVYIRPCTGMVEFTETSMPVGLFIRARTISKGHCCLTLIGLKASMEVHIGYKVMHSK